MVAELFHADARTDGHPNTLTMYALNARLINISISFKGFQVTVLQNIFPQNSLCIPCYFHSSYMPNPSRHLTFHLVNNLIPVSLYGQLLINGIPSHLPGDIRSAGQLYPPIGLPCALLHICVGSTRGSHPQLNSRSPLRVVVFVCLISVFFTGVLFRVTTAIFQVTYT